MGPRSRWSVSPPTGSGADDGVPPLGRTGLRVGPVALGTMNLGPVTPGEQAHAIMDRALDRGVVLFDTADVYGADANRTIADASPLKGAPRRLSAAGPPPISPGGTRSCWSRRRTGGWGRARATCSCPRGACTGRASRPCAGCAPAHLDVFLLHHVDRATGWDEIWEALGDLRQVGKIRCAGTSNFAGWQIVRGRRRRRRVGCSASSRRRHLRPHGAHRGAGRAAGLPRVRDRAAALQPAQLGVARRDPRQAGDCGPQRERPGGPGLAARRDAIERFEALCAEFGAAPAVVAQAWLCAQDGVASVVVGARKAAHLDDGIAAAETVLPPDALAALDEIFPGPGPAPEAYAW
ncbi:aldo/keto reductase [Pseudonocardia sp. DLS-67]